MRAALGKCTSARSRMQATKSSAVRLVVTLTLRQGRWTSRIALFLPVGRLDGQLLDSFDAAVKALGRQHADLDFHHVQPAGMFGDVVELQSAQQASCFLSRECLVERAGGVSGQIIEDDADARGLGEVHVGEVAHAGGEVERSPAGGDLDLAPGPMDIEEDEQIGGPVAQCGRFHLLRFFQNCLENISTPRGPPRSVNVGRA
jgi:hypothetical protein